MEWFFDQVEKVNPGSLICPNSMDGMYLQNGMLSTDSTSIEFLVYASPFDLPCYKNCQTNGGSDCIITGCGKEYDDFFNTFYFKGFLG
jgi:hypothetical protein